MAKRRRSVSLSFVLLRFAIGMLGCMLACCLAWYIGLLRFQNNGFTYRPATSNLQVEQMLSGQPKAFVTPGDDFLADYALFGQNGQVLQSNVGGKKLEILAQYLQKEPKDQYVLRHTYEDGSTAVFRWRYRAEFANPVLRGMLPPFEYLWLAALGIALALCLMFNTLWLRRRLAAKLKLFSQVSAKVGAQELDFSVPHAGIREYDQALDAMEHMREALYNALSAQWAAQQKREAEIAALAHDLKTPLTLVGGNAELLLEEELPAHSRKMVEVILASSQRAKRYVSGLLEASVGAEEAFKNTSLPALFDELCQQAMAIARAKGVGLQTHNGLEGTASIQKDRLLRALGNVAQNAIEHTPAGGVVHLQSGMVDGGWQVAVRDQGPGFSKAALRHAAERLWRADAARAADGHNGLGLWFASQVVSAHGGQLSWSNGESGGIVTARLPVRGGMKPPEP